MPGDAVARALLYEGANSTVVRVKAVSPLRAWASKLALSVAGKKRAALWPEGPL